MAKIIISELRIFPCFADIHRYPASVGQEFCPAMISLDGAFVLVGWDGSADGETRRDTDAARQSNEVGVEIRAVTGAHITGVLGVAAAPASSRFVVAHPTGDVVVERLGRLAIAGLSDCCLRR